jgi:hypothetical protein
MAGKSKRAGTTPVPVEEQRQNNAPMAVEVVPIGSISPDPANVRRHPERNLEAIRASLRRFGQQKPIVVDEAGIIRAGNGTYAAARDLGWSEVAVVRTDLAGSEATAYAIADNRTAELAAWDEEALADTLKSLEAEGFDLDAVGFDPHELGDLIEKLGAATTPGGGAVDQVDVATGSGDETEAEADGPKIFADDVLADSMFRWYRENGFPYRDLPIWRCMRQINRLARTTPENLIRSVAAYQVPDVYHRHRFHAAAEGMRSPFQAYSDDTMLAKAIRLAIEHNKDVETVLWVVNGTQACANFRPGFACKFYRDYCKSGDTVLDTSTGYGGRLVGFMASGIAGRYIGVDPSTKTHAGNLKMAADLGFADKVELHNLPAEDLSHEVVADRCDFAFTSPPYFRKEHYSDEPTQSWRRYPTGDAWRDGFLVAMLSLQFAALKPGCHAIVNIADVTLDGRTYSLAGWAIEAGKAAGFEYLRTDEFPIAKQKRFGAGQDDEIAIEPVIVFRKPA